MGVRDVDLIYCQSIWSHLFSGNELCLPKALVLGRAYAEGGCHGTDFHSFTRSRTRLEAKALELMKLAGVDKRTDYGIPELEKFQVACHLRCDHLFSEIADSSTRLPNQSSSRWRKSTPSVARTLSWKQGH